MKATFYGGEERMLMKLVVDAETDRILGCHMVGPDAPEMIQMAAIALKMGVDQGRVGRHLRRPSDGGGGTGHLARADRADGRLSDAPTDLGGVIKSSQVVPF